MPRSILVVDDNKVNRMALGGILRPHYSVVEAEGGREAISILQQEGEAVSAILLDLGMPDMDGYQVLGILRQSPTLSQIPVIVATASTEIETEITALHAGAADFITKPYNGALTLARLENLINLRESAAVISGMQRDKLTGVLNREGFLAKAADMIASKPEGYYMISSIDIEKFSLINGQYGSDEGDEVLKWVAKTLENALVPLGGLCARVTSDNFAIMYPAKFCDSGELSHSRFMAKQASSSLPPFTYSIGRCLADDPSLSVSAVYDRAYLAKSSIKGRYGEYVAVYDEEMLAAALRRKCIVDEMKPALAEGQFEAWFQPQYNNTTGALIGAEALARWRHPERGLVPPGDFIPVFEQTGFVYELDKFIWEHACIFLRACIDEGRTTLPVSVNVSRHDVLCDDLIDVLMGLLAKYELPVDLLRLEITESAFADSPERIISVVGALVSFGFTVEIDDFGSGYSSLNTLKDVPAQVIKMDMRFLRGGDNLERGGSIIESIVRMAKWLGMHVIAEGVETADQAAYLASIGCEYSQGYFFGWPMPRLEYAELLSTVGHETNLISLKTTEHLDNNAFWSPDSMDTLIFNSYVGAACVLEYFKGRINVVRATESFIKQMVGLGMPEEGLMTIDWAEYMDETSHGFFSEALKQSLGTRESVTQEYGFIGLPGCPEKVYLRCFLHVIASVGDRHLIYSITEDTTAQKEAEVRQRVADEKVRALLDKVDGGVSAVVSNHARTRFLFVNERFFEMMGYTREQYEAEVKMPYDIIHPDDKERIEAETAKLEAGKEGKTLEYRIVKRDGAVIWIRNLLSIINLEDVDEPVFLSIYTDITEEIANELKLSEAELVQAVIGALNGGIAALTLEDGELDYVFMNNQYCEILGYTREQFIAELPNGFRDAVLTEDEPRVLAVAKHADDTGEPVAVEFRARRRDGSVVDVHTRVSVCRFAGIDKPVQISVMHDITKEKAPHRYMEPLRGGDSL